MRESWFGIAALLGALLLAPPVQATKLDAAEREGYLAETWVGLGGWYVVVRESDEPNSKKSDARPQAVRFSVGGTVRTPNRWLVDIQSTWVSGVPGPSGDRNQTHGLGVGVGYAVFAGERVTLAPIGRLDIGVVGSGPRVTAAFFTTGELFFGYAFPADALGLTLGARVGYSHANPGTERQLRIGLGGPYALLTVGGRLPFDRRTPTPRAPRLLDVAGHALVGWGVVDVGPLALAEPIPKTALLIAVGGTGLQEYVAWDLTLMHLRTSEGRSTQGQKLQADLTSLLPGVGPRIFPKQDRLQLHPLVGLGPTVVNSEALASRGDIFWTWHLTMNATYNLGEAWKGWSVGLRAMGTRAMRGPAAVNNPRMDGWEILLSVGRTQPAGPDARGCGCL